jgi:hypothetical protein
MWYTENDETDWTSLGAATLGIVDRLRETIDPRGYAKSEEAGYGEYNPKRDGEVIEAAHVVFVVLRRTRMR